MDAEVRGVSVHYVEHGSGMPIVCLHGAGVDHRELEGALEPLLEQMPGFRRIYPDLPGMGHTPAPESLASNEDVLDVLLAFVDAVIGDQQFLVLGHSYGGYLGRALAHRSEQARGLALVCPIGEYTRDVSAHEPVVVDPALSVDLEPADAETFRSYFVVQTPETLQKFRERVQPSAALVDEAGLGRIFSNWELRQPASDEEFAGPVLIIAGRRDATAGFAGPESLGARYPHATVAVLDGVGHALLHEDPEAVRPLVAGWAASAQQ